MLRNAKSKIYSKGNILEVRDLPDPRGETVEWFKAGLHFTHTAVGGHWHLGGTPRALARSEF